MGDMNYQISASSMDAQTTIVQTPNGTLTVGPPFQLEENKTVSGPEDYLSAALIGSINAVCHMVASEMGLAINNLNFLIQGTIDPDTCMGFNAQSRPGYKELHITIDADIDAGEDKKVDWISNVRDRCPITDTVSHLTPFLFTVR